MAFPIPVMRDTHWKELRMDVRPSGDLMELRWDAGAQAAKASRGRLDVTDGDSRRQFDLEADQLRNGILTYKPVSGDVQFRLSMYGKGGEEIAGGMVRLKPVTVAAAKPSEGGADRTATDNAPAPEKTAAPAASAATPATEVHRAQPRISEGIRSRMSGPVIIPVQVEINTRGRVVRALPEKNPEGDTVYRYLADQARRAAYGWRFRPAETANGEKVASSKTLRFVFAP